MNRLKHAISSFLGDRLNRFYTLTFAPLSVILYFHREWPFSAVIPIYAFIILTLKRSRLAFLPEANNIQKIFGLLLVLASFFLYYAWVPFFPSTVYYGSPNYAVYLVGLFLLFFPFSALKEAFAPVFLIVAVTSSGFVAAWLKPFLSPFTNDFAYIILSILRVLGMDANIYYSSRNFSAITFPSLSGRIVSASFVYECIGVHSALVFSILLLVILFEEPSDLGAKLAYAIMGLLGTFALNILRVTIIFLADYFYGAEVGGTIHYGIGYALFSAWTIGFFYVFSKRQRLHARIKSFWARLR